MQAPRLRFIALLILSGALLLTAYRRLHLLTALIRLVLLLTVGGGGVTIGGAIRAGAGAGAFADGGARTLNVQAVVVGWVGG